MREAAVFTLFFFLIKYIFSFGVNLSNWVVVYINEGDYFLPL